MAAVVNRWALNREERLEFFDEGARTWGTKLCEGAPDSGDLFSVVIVVEHQPWLAFRPPVGHEQTGEGPRQIEGLNAGTTCDQVVGELGRRGLEAQAPRVMNPALD